MENTQTVQLKEGELLALVDKNRALDATYKLIEIILGTNDFDEMSQKIADTIPMALGYELAILWLVDEQKQKLVKTAISQTIKDQDTLKKLKESLRSSSIALGYEDNLSIRAIKDQRQYVTPNLYDLLGPAITFDDAKELQILLKTKLNVATPLTVRDKTIGVLIVSMSKTANQLSDFEREMLRKFSENAGIALENSRLYKNLKEAKNELNEAYENLTVLNKMKDEFLTVASHELRTPMTIVKSYLWMLEQQKNGRLNAKQTDYLQKAIKGTQRMIDLINDMLNISRFEQDKVLFKIEQVNICELIKEILISFEIKIRNKGIYIKFDEDCIDTFVDIDKEKTRDVIMNLIDNAVKFTDTGGITVGIENEEEKVVIWIKDTGSGVNPADLPKLFHKFGRIDNSYTIASDTGGTGLGLYIVKLYVEGMGGRVWATSEGLGKGSTFWISLPKGKIQKTGLKKADIPVQQITSVR
ncbi:GAF domain-containing sensor histidine kinase [candidate division WWE3 bacterium]|uniref:histidine kinase n=1 Tax=candidate division WWE3 bacterium TaxID=2053526 RepID=A0A7X9HSK9_UNCKA|nr:GAF domain-containing sensor histidine kinase [candidate division WWE3 bacterium]